MLSHLVPRRVYRGMAGTLHFIRQRIAFLPLFTPPLSPTQKTPRTYPRILGRKSEFSLRPISPNIGPAITAVATPEAAFGSATVAAPRKQSPPAWMPTGSNAVPLEV